MGQHDAIPEFRNSGCPEIRNSGFPEIRISGNPDFRISGNPEIRISGYPDIRISGSPGIRTSGFYLILPYLTICNLILRYFTLFHLCHLPYLTLFYLIHLPYLPYFTLFHLICMAFFTKRTLHEKPSNNLFCTWDVSLVCEPPWMQQVHCQRRVQERILTSCAWQMPPH